MSIIAESKPEDERDARNKAVQEKMERAVRMAVDILRKSKFPSCYDETWFNVEAVEMALVLYKDLS